MPGTYLIALGGNMPTPGMSPVETLGAALLELAVQGCKIRAVSRFFQTPCFPAGAGPDYVNAAVSVQSELAPRAMLDLVHKVEAKFGRERIERWGMRTLDVDLIAAGDTVLPDLSIHGIWRTLPADEQVQKTPDQLILPHPRVQDRAFVLIPLNDIAPRWVHPVLGLSVEEMLENLGEDDCKAVVPL